MQERDQNTATDGIRDVYLTDSSQGEVNGHFHPSPGNDDPENRVDQSGEHGGDGLTALVGLSQGTSNTDETDGEWEISWTFSGVSVQMMGE
ncbi:hypothetical protein Tco_1020596 [Tanacetum coccineum]